MVGYPEIGGINLKSDLRGRILLVWDCEITANLVGRPNDSCLEHLLSWIDQIMKVYSQEEL